MGGYHLDQDDIHPSDLIGRSYLQPVHNDDGTRYRCEIVQALKEYKERLGESKERQRFIVSVHDGEYEEIVTYNEILDYITSSNEEETYWKFKRIVVHQGPLDPKHPDYMGSRYNVMVEWESGETTTEPLSTFAADAL